MFDSQKPMLPNRFATNPEGGRAMVKKNNFLLSVSVLLGLALSQVSAGVPASVSLHNRLIQVSLNGADGRITVQDQRNHQQWSQKVLTADNRLLSARAADSGANAIETSWLHVPSGLGYHVGLSIPAESPEVLIELAADAQAEMPGNLTFPQPFVTERGSYLVIPMNEGISYPVEDASIPTTALSAYSSFGICMGFFGASDGQRGYMGILETPNDARIRLERLDGNLCVAPAWEPQKKHFGYDRKIRYVFFDQGGHVAICKRYRAYAQQRGLVKTLAEKRQENPNVDLLVGAVNVWARDSSAVSLVKEMQALGIERILWSAGGQAETIRALNEIPGVLTSRYDIYQDLMDPSLITNKLGGYRHGDWVQQAWPKDIVIGASGDWIKGWQVKGKDGTLYPCAVLCDAVAPPYARQRILEDLKKRPFRCRFIDTTTASALRECYSSAHPQTRSECRQHRMELLDVVSREMKQVTGCENGTEAAVPYLHYLEGMMSLSQYRIPDSGRNTARIVDEVPDRVAKFQVGHRYRLPLWELVFHDCVVSQWY
ncbi:MAG: glycoside hydrolase [Verrucomicrobiota bacterium]